MPFQLCPVTQAWHPAAYQTENCSLQELKFGSLIN